jgi:hypothetical protein
MVSKKKKCPACGKNSSIWEKADKYPIFKKMEAILRSNKSIHTKKIALFNCLKSIEAGKLEPSEETRLNCLLQSKLYAELAKEKMREYKNLTVEDYSKKK